MKRASLLSLGVLLLFACDQPMGIDTAAPPVGRLATTTPGYIIDTGAGGTGSTGGSALFAQGSTVCSPQPQCAGYFQFLAGKFTVSSEATVTSAEAWVSALYAGSVTVKILPDAAGVPGATAIASQTYAMDAGAFSWRVFSDLNAVLQAGTYWLSLEPVANGGFDGGMQGGAANPLADYAFFSDGNNRWVAYSLFNQNPGFGMRIFGTLAETEEPPAEATELVMDLRTVVAALEVARGTRNALDASLRTALAALAANDTAGACTALDDFIKQVRAQRKKLGDATVNALTADANAIRAELGC